MSLITVGSEVCGRLDVYCELCQRSVGLMSPQEIGELACAGIRVVCFDCDGGGVDLPPKCFLCDDDIYVVFVGGCAFEASWEDDWSFRSSGLDLCLTLLGHFALDCDGRPDVVVEQSLSSSTYQHKTGASGEVQL